MLGKNSNGAHAIVLNQQKQILVVRANYGEKLWMLPGGGIERGESPRHAAQEEVEEETGLMVFEHRMQLIAMCTQRLGLAALYETDYYQGNLVLEPTQEILSVQFMDFQEIIDRREEFGSASIRMIIMHRRCMSGLD